jgi:hypothetical protein
MTSAATDGRLRLLPVPAIDPPYDDEVGPRPPFVEGSLALAFPAADGIGVPLRLVPPAAGHDDDDFGPQPTGRAALPDPRQWSHRLAQAVVEVLAGARSAAQLSRFASLEVLEHLERAAGRFAGGRGEPAPRPLVASVHVCEPRDGIVEACAIVDTGRRRRALALRLEGIDGRWRCTALQVG